MFILSRKSDEAVIIDGFNNLKRALKVTILEVKGGRVKLGFEVNSDAPVHRSASRQRVHGGIEPNCGAGGPEMFGA